MDLRGRTAEPTPDSAFKRLEALARRTARDLVRQKRPFDSYPGRLPGHAGRTRRLLDAIHLPGRRTPVVTHPPAWRLHSIRLSETSTHAFTATGAVGERKNYVRKDDELWLRSNGEMFILAFRTECESGKWSRSVASRALTHLSAARYDYTATRACKKDGWKYWVNPGTRIRTKPSRGCCPRYRAGKEYRLAFRWRSPVTPGGTRDNGAHGQRAGYPLNKGRRFSWNALNPSA
jgi:hypothetical protein